MSQINFVKNNDTQYIPEHKLYKFHQICIFRDPQTSKYNVRTIIHNENQEIVKVYDKQYNSDQCRILINSCRTNDYKCYQTFDLELIDYPDTDDLYKTHSDLLSNETNYNGYATF